MHTGILLFENFETLDVFGPVEILGRLKDDYDLHFYSLSGGLVTNAHGVSVMTKRIETQHHIELFMIPGGMGTRIEVNNTTLIDSIMKIAESSTYVLTICTGSALLAKTGLLNGRRATSNKRAFSWVATQGDQVHWKQKARWTVDGKYYTSSGVSAGMDMTLGFLKDLHGATLAREVAHQIEYRWQENKDEDNFAN